jgi:hypothetical protein
MIYLASTPIRSPYTVVILSYDFMNSMDQNTERTGTKGLSTRMYRSSELGKVDAGYIRAGIVDQLLMISKCLGRVY